jgi:sodium/potassium-transporting ATPase subunit alpha
MKIHQFTAGEALRSLQSAPAGLSADQAARRLVEFGPNQVVRARRESVLWQFSKEFIHFFALIWQHRRSERSRQASGQRTDRQ